MDYEPKANAIMTNDNASYWQGYLGYPGVAYLLAASVITYDPSLAGHLHGFAWKDLATQYKNDWAKVEARVRDELAARGVDLAEFDAQLQDVAEQLAALKLEKLGARVRPPR